MDYEALKKEAYEKGVYYEAAFGGCTQAVLATLMELFPEYRNEMVYKAATGLAAGAAQSGNICGACSGGILFIGLVAGRPMDNMADPDNIKLQTQKLCRELQAKFKEKYRTFICAGIQALNMGRHYRMYDDTDRQAFLDAGGHDSENCPSVVGNACVWTIEVLEGHGLI